jgi:rhodanese-related sulfurtransferase
MKHATVKDAHDLQQQGHTYVDVRSTVEFAHGHPAGAVNVPLLEPDERTGQMTPNPDFMRVMAATFPPETRLLIGCQAGGRSMRAAQMLEASGFTDVTNVRGGFAGSGGAFGGGDPGWAPSGLPVATEDEPGAAYQALLDKADASS